MPSGRPPVTVPAGKAARLAGMTLRCFHRGWRNFPALVDAAVEPLTEGGNRSWVRSKVMAFGAARGIVGGNPFRIAFDGDDRVERVAGALAVLFEELGGEPAICNGCRRMAQMAVDGLNPCGHCGQARPVEATARTA